MAWQMSIFKVAHHGEILRCSPLVYQSKAQILLCLMMPLSPNIGRQIAQTRMRPLAVVANAPRLDHLPRFLQGREPFLIQALSAKAPIERFDVTILRRLAWLDELQLYLVLISPQVKGFAPKLAAIVNANQFGRAALLLDSFQ